MRRLGRVVAVWRHPNAHHTCARSGRTPGVDAGSDGVFEVSEQMRPEDNAACETAETEIWRSLRSAENGVDHGWLRLSTTCEKPPVPKLVR
jgi:hypothetical protein